MGDIRITLPFHPDLLTAIRTYDPVFPFVHSGLNGFDILLFIFKKSVTKAAGHIMPASIPDQFYRHSHHPFLKIGKKKVLSKSFFSKVPVFCNIHSGFCRSNAYVVSEPQ